MKIRNILALTLAATASALVAKDIVTITLLDGTQHNIEIDTNCEKLTFTQHGDSIVVGEGHGTFCLDDIDDIRFVYEEDTPTPTPTVKSDTITITWTQGAAPTIACTADSVTMQADGDHILATNTNTDTEYTYLLQGTSNDGSFTLVSDYKSTIVLNGVSLQSAQAEALNIRCGKRVSLRLAEGTQNKLADAKTDNGQKAALYCKGHLEVSGTGTLDVQGNVNHAISTKEYLQLKKSTGAIHITAAANDGIHAGQYFLMNGGDVSMRNIQGDGIQAEATTDATDEQNGQLMIRGGKLDIQTAADDECGLKSDSLMTISDGEITISSQGAGSKSMKSGTDIRIEGGTVSIMGSGAVLNSETSSKGISTDGNAYLLGGSIYITMSGDGGKGVKTDGNAYVGQADALGTGPLLCISTTGGSSNTGSGNTGGNTGGGWRPGGGGGWGGGGWGPGGGESSTGSSAKAIKCMGSYYQYGGNIYISTTGSGAEGIESKQKTATSVNFCGGNTFITTSDDCINSAGQLNFTGANVLCYSTSNDAIDSNYGRAGAITITDGCVLAFSQRGGAEMGFDCDGMSYVKVTGGTAIAGGGSQGGASSSMGSGSTHYKLWSSTLSYTSGSYYSVVADGANVLTFRMPCSVSSSYNVYASSLFTSSRSHVIYSGTQAPHTDGAISFVTDMQGTQVPSIWLHSDITTGKQLGTFTPQ